MQKYRCHKEVEAFVVTEIRKFTRCGLESGDSVEEWTELRGEDGEAVRLDAAYEAKHNPMLRGYYVRYADGYESFSPADAFEGGYTAIGVVEPLADVMDAMGNLAPHRSVPDASARDLLVDTADQVLRDLVDALVGEQVECERSSLSNTPVDRAMWRARVVLAGLVEDADGPVPVEG